MDRFEEEWARRTEILQALNKVKALVNKPIREYPAWLPAAGICEATTKMLPGNIECPIKTVTLWQLDRIDIFREWPDTSGDTDYPVKSFSTWQSPAQRFYATANLWVGEYGQSRRNLLDFCIQWYQQELGLN